MISLKNGYFLMMKLHLTSKASAINAVKRPACWDMTANIAVMNFASCTDCQKTIRVK